MSSRIYYDPTAKMKPSGFFTAYDKIAVPTSFAIKKVIFNGPATIVLWVDGTKTVVKCQDETFDPEKGLAMAIAKKALGNKGNYFNMIKKWTGKYEEDRKQFATSLVEDFFNNLQKQLGIKRNDEDETL